MNFLGHAYIARNHTDLIAGNFAGDSYKGYLNNFNDLPGHILNGIKLHRFIDDFTDTHEKIQEVAALFKEGGVSKVTYIACDILLDHHLSANWNNYSVDPYNQFIEKVYFHTDAHLEILPKDFKFLYERLKEYGWFYDYPSEEGIRKILFQFSRRIGFENDLAQCQSIYLENKEKIDQAFETFLNDIVNKSEVYILDLKA